LFLHRASNLDPPTSASQVAGITDVHHHTPTLIGNISQEFFPVIKANHVSFSDNSKLKDIFIK
jgi:hypothetical protein